MPKSEKPKIEKVKSDRSVPGFLETPAVCPRTKGTVVALISYKKATDLQKYGPAYKYNEMLSLVRETLVDPHAIWAYNQDEFGGYCYTRPANYACTNRGTKAKRPEGMIFAVFVTDSMKVIEWGWEPHDRDDTDRPMIWEGRLEAKLWSKQK
jgi:hypothetical protein